jgi:hypothetical protein
MTAARSAVVVVGAGPTGLGCAAALAERIPVVIVDRIPVVGGTAGWHAPPIRACAARAQRLGAHVRLGVTAIRWRDQRLTLVGPGAVDELAAHHLFVAAGLRPATPADLRITGDRPAGIVAATVAEHLLDAGIRLWKVAVLIGDGPWVAAVASAAHRLGTRVVTIGASGEWGDEHHARPNAWQILGGDHVRAVRLEYGSSSSTVEVSCDAVVLAADPVPNRNIDGAITAPTEGVTFAQPLSPWSCEERLEVGRHTAEEWLRATADASR